MSDKQTQQQPQTPAPKSASQRIEDLEKGLMSMYQAFNGVAQDLNVAKEALKILGNKVSSIQAVSQRGEPLTDENVSKAMIENNVEDLKQKVDTLITQGILVNQETTADNSFVVGRELNDEGTIVNPRLQFALAALQPEVQDKIRGHKTGDIVDIQEGKLKFEVLEVYSIEAPKTPQAEATEAAPAEAPTTETTATEAPAALADASLETSASDNSTPTA